MTRKNPLISAMLNWGFASDGTLHERSLFLILQKSSSLLISFIRSSSRLNSSAHGQSLRNINAIGLSEKSRPISDNEQLESWFTATLRVVVVPRNPSMMLKIFANISNINLTFGLSNQKVTFVPRVHNIFTDYHAIGTLYPWWPRKITRMDLWWRSLLTRYMQAHPRKQC